MHWKGEGCYDLCSSCHGDVNEECGGEFLAVVDLEALGDAREEYERELERHKAREDAIGEFKRVSLAYRIVKDEELRRIYDACGWTGLVQSESYSENNVFEQDAFQQYERFFSGEDDDDKQYLLIHGPEASDEEEAEEEEGKEAPAEGAALDEDEEIAAAAAEAAASSQGGEVAKEKAVLLERPPMPPMAAAATFSVFTETCGEGGGPMVPWRDLAAKIEVGVQGEDGGGSATEAKQERPAGGKGGRKRARNS